MPTYPIGLFTAKRNGATEAHTIPETWPPGGTTISFQGTTLTPTEWSIMDP